MAISIRSRERIDTKDDKPVNRVEMDVDTVAELPAVNSATSEIYGIGSIAWVISTGDFYGLTSSGEWVNQATGEVNSSAVASSLTAAPIANRMAAAVNALSGYDFGAYVESDEPVEEVDSDTLESEVVENDKSVSAFESTENGAVE